MFRSVTDLKSKGIHFMFTKIKSLNGVRFSPAKIFQSAKLFLPVWDVTLTMHSKVFFMNIFAYECSPQFPMPKSVCGYISFMKLLVVSKEDVKELRENKIIINRLWSDDEVVQVFKALNTYGAEDRAQFMQVKKDIEEYYNSKAKTWMADLRTTYFSNPWSIIALAGTTLLLCLAIAQTYYASHDDKCCPKGINHLH